jgi:hypothetical protein
MASSLITEYIQEAKEQEISIQNLHYQELHSDPEGNKMLMLSDSIIADYKDDLENIAYSKTLTEEETHHI